MPTDNDDFVEKKIEELKARFQIEIDEFIAKIKDQVLQAVGKQIDESIIEYVYAQLDQALAELIDSVMRKGESFIRNKFRKLKLWFKRKL